MSDIVKRLRKVESGRAVRGEWAINWFRNPDGPEAAAEIERLTRRLEGATRLLNAWHFEYHHGRRLEGIDDDTTTWLGGIDVPDRAADQPDAGPQAPIIRVSVDEFGSARVVKHYAPGLPFGEHDLYCEPEATAPMLRDHRRRGFMDATGRFVPEPPAAPPPPDAPRYAECVCMICGGYSDQAVSIATDPTNEVPK